MIKALWTKFKEDDPFFTVLFLGLAIWCLIEGGTVNGFLAGIYLSFSFAKFVRVAGDEWTKKKYGYVRTVKYEKIRKTEVRKDVHR